MFLLVYELAMLLLGLTGVSFLKLLVTVSVWISFFIAFNEYVRYQFYFKKVIPYLAYIVITLLLFWNVFNVFRSLFNKDGPITTILGNVSASLSILVPFVIIFSIHKINLRAVHKFFFKILTVGFFVFIFFLLSYGRNLQSSQLLGLILLFIPVAFLITGVPLESNKNRVIIGFCVILSLCSAYLFSSRTTVLRIVLLLISLCGLYVYLKFRFKWILSVAFIMLIVPFLLLQESYITGESAFEKYLSDSTDDEYSIDTRTFLYQELFEDLTNNNRLIVGKGSNGSYYSQYFYDQDVGETHNRNNLEVGILGILLKGGLIAVALNLLILFISIYYCFFKSDNLYTVGIGFFLIVHTLLLFVENYTVYSSYNFFLWFFIGLGLSKNIRGLSNLQIKRILNTN